MPTLAAKGALPEVLWVVTLAADVKPDNSSERTKQQLRADRIGRTISVADPLPIPKALVR
jgi:hypothetical protein